jgi:hypothetical protein
MPFNLHPKSFHEKFIDNSEYEVETTLPKNNFKKSLVEILKNYKDVRITPGSLAMEGDDWKLKNENIYIIYTKWKIGTLPKPIKKEFINIKTKEEKTFSLNHMLY